MEILAYGVHIDAPADPLVLANTSADGHQAAGQYMYTYTEVTRFGETIGAPIATINVPISNRAVLVTLPSTFIPEIKSFNLYRTVVNGSVLMFLTNILIGATDYLDTHADGDLGPSAPPAISTADSKCSYFGTYRWTDNVEFDADVIINGNIINNPPGGPSANFSTSGGDASNTAFTNISGINSANCNLLSSSRIPITSSAQSYTSSFLRPSTDGAHIYLTTQALEGDSPDASQNGYLVCVNSVSGHVIWKKLISSYSGIPGDQARCAPTIWGNYLYFGSATTVPQTFAPYINVVTRYTGIPTVGTGRPPRFYCVDKLTGDLVWEREITGPAADINGLGNWRCIDTAPTVVEIDMFGSGITQPIVITGTSSGQSFRPWLYCPDGNPFGVPFGSLPEFQMTDVGLIVVMNGLTGEILRVHEMARTFQAGQLADPGFFLPGQPSLDSYHFITPADLAPGGLLNSATPDFGTQLMWLLDGSHWAPELLQGQVFNDNTGIPNVIPVGANAGANFNGLVVQVPVTFKPSTAQVNYLGTDYGLVNQYLDGTDGMRKARIIMQIMPGQTLNAEQAYQCSWWGCSTWGTSCAVKYIEGTPYELYIASGQNHATPLFESELFNDPTYNWIPQTMAIQSAQQTYVSSPTPGNFAALQAVYAQIDTAITNGLSIGKCAYGQENRFDSITCINLIDNGLFDIKWSFPTIGWDTWHLGYVVESQRKTSEGGFHIPGYTGIQTFFGAQVGGDFDFGAGPIYQQSLDRVIMTNKGGYVWVLDVSAGSPVQISKVRLSNGGTVGGSNYGASFDGRFLYVSQSNAIDEGAVNADPASGGTLPQDFAPLLDWYAQDTTLYPSHNTFVTCFDTINMTINWLSLMSPGNPGVVTYTPTTCVNDVVYAIDGLGYLRCFHATNGALIASYLMEAGGQTGIMPMNNALYTFPARSGMQQNFPTSTGYHSGQFMYKFTL